MGAEAEAISEGSMARRLENREDRESKIVILLLVGGYSL